MGGVALMVCGGRASVKMAGYAGGGGKTARRPNCCARSCRFGEPIIGM